MSKQLIYLDSHVLQQDMRIRLPKSILSNLQAEKGKTMFSIYYDNETNSLVLKAESRSDCANEK